MRCNQDRLHCIHAETSEYRGNSDATWPLAMVEPNGMKTPIPEHATQTPKGFWANYRQANQQIECRKGPYSLAGR